MKKRLLFASLLLFLTACTNPTEEEDLSNDDTEEVVEDEDAQTPEVEEPVEEEVEESEPLDSELTVIADSLEIPWSIYRVDDTFYISERTGSIVKIEGEEVTRQAVQLERPLATVQEAGLLGFALNPEVDDQTEAIAYYTYNGTNGPTNRVVILKFLAHVWMASQVLIDDIPSGNVHNGGRLAIGPDGKLYITTGDAAVLNVAQDVNSLAGKILRMNLDGSMPEDNPFEDSYVYSYGHRNPQGLGWLEDGTMYASEHGNQANDEINRIEAGFNYGWPIIEGTTESAEMETPIFTSGSGNTWAPSGMAVADNKLYVAALRGQGVLEFDLGTEEFQILLTDHGRIRDIFIEEGYLYFVTNNTDGRGNPIEGDDHLYRIGLQNVE